jgi:FecR protein
VSDPNENLIEKWLDGSLDGGEQDVLLAWLKEKPQHMRRFVEANLRQQMLCDAAAGELMIDKVNLIAPAPIPVPALTDIPRRSTRQVMAFLGGLATCLLIAIGWWFRTATLVPHLDPFVSIAMVQEIDGDLSVGDRLASTTIQINRGMLRLAFDDGVEVTLQGPADYELTALGKTRLHRGLLTATVPPGAVGFLVSTPHAEVVDLGTAFGVALDEDGNSEVSVFDGEVEVQPNRDRKKKLVQEGQTVRVTKTNEIESSKFAAGVYETLWPVSSGIAGSTGAFRFAAPWPRRMGLAQSNTDIFVLPEGYAQTLSESLSVNITATGKYRLLPLAAKELSAGTRVRSFLLQFKPVDEGNGATPDATAPDQLQRIVGDITFDRPVLGLIVNGDELRASDAKFSVRSGQVPQKGRGLELFGTPRDDVVSLSEDRHTVKLDLAAFGAYADQVRVIVDQSITK